MLGDEREREKEKDCQKSIVSRTKDETTCVNSYDDIGPIFLV
jgi:hypothetical protein